MKKVLTAITFGILIITIVLMLTGCGESLEGRWEYKNMSGLTQAFIEFRSDGTCVGGSMGYGEEETTYTIDSDGTLKFFRNTYRKTTLEEMRKMDSTEAYNYYAFDGSSAYFGDNTKEYKKQ